jgi:hypothetical protein
MLSKPTSSTCSAAAQVVAYYYSSPPFRAFLAVECQTLLATPPPSSARWRYHSESPKVLGADTKQRADLKQKQRAKTSAIVTWATWGLKKEQRARTNA